MLHARNTCPALWDRATLLAYDGNGSVEIEFPRDSGCEECVQEGGGVSPTRPLKLRCHSHRSR
eukprot:3530813-Alexandrium_andersonii.AAC.1